MTNPYATLGLPPTASADEVDRAYKRKAREAHPDRNGGDNQRFLAVQKAYDLLKDPELRQHFDETGEWGERKADNSHAQPIGVLQGILVAVLKMLVETGQNTASADVAQLMRDGLSKVIGEQEEMRRKVKTILKSFKDCRERFEGGEDDPTVELMRSIAERRIMMAENELEQCETHLAACKEAKKMIGKLKFKHKKQAGFGFTNSATVSASGSWFAMG